MGNYEEARRFNCKLNFTAELKSDSDCDIALLREKEPTNMQASSLEQLIDDRVKRGTRTSQTSSAAFTVTDTITEGYIGMALVGGAAAIGTILLAGLIRRARK